MKPRFLADADFNNKIVLGLRRREPLIDFVSARDAGVPGATDPEVLAIAARAGRVLVSHDRKTMPGHFFRFRQSESSPGLIVVSQELDIGPAIEDLLLIWTATEAEEWIDRIGFVPV
jgi:predicted nuclease of predicted toxin-antitoxin system